MEAISMGLPVIATDVGGTREIVENGKNGYLLDKDCTVKEIVESLNGFHSMNSEQYKKMCDNALEFGRKEVMLRFFILNL